MRCVALLAVPAALAAASASAAPEANLRIDPGMGIGKLRLGMALWRERTSRGVGVGSLERVLGRAYRNLRCGRLETSRGGGYVQVLSASRACTLFAPSGRRTIFTSMLERGPFEWPYLLSDRQRTARVAEVAVAEPR